VHNGSEVRGKDEHPEEDHVAPSLPVGWGRCGTPSITRPLAGTWPAAVESSHCVRMK
jgi:hypothetical protein